MAKKKKQKNSRRRPHRPNDSKSLSCNFVPDAGPGCHIARADLESDWILGWEQVDPDELEEVPDLAVDPDDETLTVCNIRKDHVVAYVTVYERPVRGRLGILSQGSCTDDNGQSRRCTTLIVLCPPHTFCHLGYIDLPKDAAGNALLEDLLLDSDVQPWNRHKHPVDTHTQSIGFPLQGPGPFLCTQSEDGCLTHFFAGNLHAIDFRCPVGTPILAVGSGRVVHAQTEHSLTGIAVSNLFKWNAIILELDERDTDDTLPWLDPSDPRHLDARSAGPLFVEYVHIATSTVEKGDRVETGQVIGTSGSVGFSPEPHLHLAAYRSGTDTAETVRVYYRTTSDSDDQLNGGPRRYLPVAGKWYDHGGPVDVGNSST